MKNIGFILWVARLFIEILVVVLALCGLAMLIVEGIAYLVALL